eukprot:3360834-Rhodomonas_salina.2
MQGHGTSCGKSRCIAFDFAAKFAGNSYMDQRHRSRKGQASQHVWGSLHLGPSVCSTPGMKPQPGEKFWLGKNAERTPD